MAVEYYKIPNIVPTNALFTVVCDDTLYSSIVNNDTAQRLFPWNDVQCVSVLPDGYTYDPNVYNYVVSNIGINIIVATLMRPSSGNVNYDYNIANNKLVRVNVTAGGSVSSFFVNNGVQSSTPGYNNALPVGAWYTSGTVGTQFVISVLLTNSNKTAAKHVRYYRQRISSGYRDNFSVNTISDFNVSTFFDGLKPVVLPKPDPYTEGSGGHSGGGGGTGTFSRTGDTVGEHNTPTLSAVDAGFITLFAPTAGEMKALASYLWSDLFSIDTFKKIFANPMDAILGLSIVPVAVPTSGSASVKVGNISTGVSMTKASTQYVKLSCGSLEVEEYWGAYLDYSPYTKCEIYLPYIGVHELSVDDVMGKTVKVVYYIDILSGACTAEIYSNNTCLYSFVGQCSASIPITGNDWTNVINGVMQIGASIGSMVASGGLTAPISGEGVARGLKSVASASSTVTSSKPSVERSGSMSGAGGMLGQQTPYLIITWPRECIPAEQNRYIGYPSFVTVNLGEIVGFNIIDSIHLENIPATSAELDEIESLLMNGVIF